MNERLVCISKTIVDPTEGNNLSTAEATFYAPIDMTIVYVSAAPHADETDGTVDIQDDGTDIITAIDCSDADVPGTWKAEGYGGDQDPVRVSAGSKIDFDFNSFSNGIAANIDIWAVVGSVFS
jgi:hypothetical protein